MEPQDLTATIFHLLGIGGTDAIHDRAGRPLHLTTGAPIPVLGERPATDKRVRPGGNLALVPGFSDDFLFNADFEDDSPLSRCGSARRLKGWQATPLADAASSPDFGARLVRGPEALSHTGKQHVALGYGLTGAANAGKLVQGSRALLAQEVRNPRAGKYTYSVHANGGGNAATYRDTFQKHFTCRLVIYGYTDLGKDATKVREFASVAFQPTFANAPMGKYEKFELSTVLRSQDGGAFQLTRGIGVAVVVEKTSPGELDLAAMSAPGFIRIDDVSLDFVARARNDDVQV